MHHPKFLHVSGWRCWSWPRPYSQDSVGSYYPVILCYTNAVTIATGLERRIFLGVGDTQSGAGARENPPRLRVGLFHLPAAVPETDPQMPCSLAESLTVLRVYLTESTSNPSEGTRGGWVQKERERDGRDERTTPTPSQSFSFMFDTKVATDQNCLTAPFRVGREVSACEEGESFCPRMQRHWVAVLASGVSLGCRAHAPISCLILLIFFKQPGMFQPLSGDISINGFDAWQRWRCQWNQPTLAVADIHPGRWCPGGPGWVSTKIIDSPWNVLKCLHLPNLGTRS